MNCGRLRLRAQVYTRKQLCQSLENEDCEAVYAPMRIVDSGLSQYKEKIILLPPEYLADCEPQVREKLSVLKEAGFYRATAHTVGHIELLSELGYDIHGGNRLNCTNSETVKYLKKIGLKDIILSAELTAEQINSIEKPVETGFIAYGRLPLMLNRRCPISDGKPCNKERCKRQLTDRLGNKLDVICSENTVEILNSDVLILSDRLSEFKTDFAVLHFTVEEDISTVITAYKNGDKPFMKKYTRGLYYRGVE